MRLLNLVLLLALIVPHTLIAQIEKVYDEHERLKTINPLSASGVWDGLGYTFHTNGGVAKETPYVSGKIVGVEKEYYENGNLRSVCQYQEGVREGLYQQYYDDGNVKMSQEWKRGVKQGKLHVYDPVGNLSMYAIMEMDTVVFVQRFDEKGQLVAEKLGKLAEAIDSTEIGEVFCFVEDGEELLAGSENAVSVVVAKLPSSYMKFSSPDGSINRGEETDAFPLILIPETERDFFRLYVQIQLHAYSQSTLVRTIEIPVRSKN